MALNCVLLKSDGITPAELINENFLSNSEGVSFSLQFGSGYPGNSGTYRCDSGVAYLSNKRLLYINTKQAKLTGATSYGRIGSKFYSFSVPLTYISDVKYEQPIFGSNYLAAIVEPVPEGGLKSTGNMKLSFKKTGGFDFFSVLQSMKERIAETGEFPTHHEPLPSYSLSADIDEPVEVLLSQHTTPPEHAYPLHNQNQTQNAQPIPNAPSFPNAPPFRVLTPIPNAPPLQTMLHSRNGTSSQATAPPNNDLPLYSGPPQDFVPDQKQ